MNLFSSVHKCLLIKQIKAGFIEYFFPIFVHFSVEKDFYEYERPTCGEDI